MRHSAGPSGGGRRERTRSRAPTHAASSVPRLVAQYRPSEAVTSTSRSPGNVRSLAKARTARFASSRFSSPTRRSSKTIANVRRVAGRDTFVATRASEGRAAVVSLASRAGTVVSTASNAVTACSFPSSRTRKSARERPPTGVPSGPRTTTSTVTRVDSAGKTGAWPRAGEATAASRPARTAARRRALFAAPGTGRIRTSMRL